MNFNLKEKSQFVPRHKRAFYAFYAITAVSIVLLSLVL